MLGICRALCDNSEHIALFRIVVQSIWRSRAYSVTNINKQPISIENSRQLVFEGYSC